MNNAETKAKQIIKTTAIKSKFKKITTGEFAAAATPRRSSGMRMPTSGKSEAKVRPIFPEGR